MKPILVFVITICSTQIIGFGVANGSGANSSPISGPPPPLSSCQKMKQIFYEVFFARLPGASSVSSASSSGQPNIGNNYVYQSIPTLTQPKTQPKTTLSSSYGGPISSSETEIKSISTGQVAPLSKFNFNPSESESISNLLESIV